jgi:hypothetical protein
MGSSAESNLEDFPLPDVLLQHYIATSQHSLLSLTIFRK